MAKYTLHFTAIISEELAATDEILDTLNEPQPPETCECGALLINGVCYNCEGDA